MPEIGAGSIFDGGDITQALRVYYQGVPGGYKFSLQQNTKDYPYFGIYGNGILHWGDANGFPDITLRRFKAGWLKTAGGISFGKMFCNATTLGTTLGSVVRKVPWYDTDDNLLGWIPVYDTIT